MIASRPSWRRGGMARRRTQRRPRGAEAAAAMRQGRRGAPPPPRCRCPPPPPPPSRLGRRGAACAKCGALAAKLENAEKRINSRDSYKPDAERHNADRAKFRRENGTHDGDRKPGKMGPPVGHKGVSHSYKPETRHYGLSACEHRVRRASEEGAAFQQDPPAARHQGGQGSLHLGRARRARRARQDQRGKVGVHSGHARGDRAARERDDLRRQVHTRQARR